MESRRKIRKYVIAELCMILLFGFLSLINNLCSSLVTCFFADAFPFLFMKESSTDSRLSELSEVKKYPIEKKTDFKQIGFLFERSGVLCVIS